MNLQQIFKAINLRVVTSKQSSKSFYGSDCREFIFEDCYHNEVGSFFVIPEGDVCEVILNGTFKDSEKGEVVLSYKWINNKFEEKRNFALSKMNRNDYNKEKFVYASYAFEMVKSETIMLGMLQKICEGGYLSNVDIQEEALSEEAFMELSKLSYRKDVSVKKLIEEFIDSGLTFADLNEKFGVKSSETYGFKNVSKEPSKKIGIDKQAQVVGKTEINTREDKKEEVQVNEQRLESVVEAQSSSVKPKYNFTAANNEKSVLQPLPEYLDGTFEIGKGFIKRDTTTRNEAFGTVEMSLKDRINPKPVIQEDHMVRYPGNKTVLSNLKQKTLVS